LTVFSPSRAINQLALIMGRIAQSLDYQEKLQMQLNRIAEGCHQSAANLYQEYHRAVYAFIRFRIGDEQAAEEILNDTFMVAFRRPQRYDQSCEYSTWLIGIAKRLCLNWQRKRTRIQALEAQSLNATDVESIASDSMSALQAIEQSQMQQALKGCIDKLPERQREAIFWAWHQERSMSDIASQMQCSEGAIKAHLHHARKKIAQCVMRVFEIGVYA
jgi:RNA polymerase sigma-70 factor, ECF subfamily